jgi:glyoxylase-like metal-dependent hydrolase (beta-lactamase superfamily II)
MSLTRRDFTRLFAASAAAGSALPRSIFALDRAPQETFFTWRAVGTRIHAALGSGGNVMLLRDGDAAALLSDCKNPGYGPTLKREAAAMGSPLRFVVNTHHHSDHVGGNLVFTADVPLLAHPIVKTRLTTWAAGVVGQQNQGLTNAIQQQRDRNGSPTLIAELERSREQLMTAKAEACLPTREVRDGEELRVGSRTVVLRHVGAGHTDNDVFLWMPEENVLHTGDLCWNRQHGFMDPNAGFSTPGWQRSVQTMLGMVNAETVVIPGHGDITDRAGLQWQWDYFEQLRDAVSAAIRQGMTREQVVALQPAAFAGVTGNLARNLGAMFDEIRGD